MHSNMQSNPIFMQLAIDLAKDNVVSGVGGPFGAVVVLRNEVVATGVNLVTSTSDPTAHAEIVAIRAACEILNSFQLTNCMIYTSCEPCPMCLAAIYWSRCEAIFYGATAADATAAGFDDGFLYAELARPMDERSIPATQVIPKQAVALFKTWADQADKVKY